MELKVTRWDKPEPPTQSKLVRAMEADGLVAYIEDDEPNHSYEAHTHPNDEVLVAVLGEITMGVGDQKWVLKPGDRLDLPANTLHWAETPSTGPSGSIVIVGPAGPGCRLCCLHDRIVLVLQIISDKTLAQNRATLLH